MSLGPILKQVFVQLHLFLQLRPQCYQTENPKHDQRYNKIFLDKIIFSSPEDELRLLLVKLYCKEKEDGT